ncbi:MAG: hypothetical protein D6679_10450 [Candidatus Hydrogenedentota bacterium]|nr:MAG: hypothetical protein D6679_10450 [Candidatus Hydrogenedentota bacterium]
MGRPKKVILYEAVFAGKDVCGPRSENSRFVSVPPWSVDSPVCEAPIRPPQVGEPTFHPCRQDACGPGDCAPWPLLRRLALLGDSSSASLRAASLGMTGVVSRTTLLGMTRGLTGVSQVGKPAKSGLVTRGRTWGQPVTVSLARTQAAGYGSAIVYG